MAKHILIIDDAPDTLHIMRAALESEGYRVTEAHDAASASAVLASTVPDLVVSDIVMPGTDGLELLRQIRSDVRLARVPIVFLTGASDASIEERAHALGVDGFLRKPLSPRTLLAAARGTLERFSQLRDAVQMRGGAARNSTPGAGETMQTGIGPLDDLAGGLPRGRTCYISGEVGTGESILCAQFLHHALVRNEGAVLATTDRPRAVLRDAQDLGLDLDPFLRAGRLVLLELNGSLEHLVESPNDLRLLARELGGHAAAVGAQRLAIMSVVTLLCGSPRLALTDPAVSGFVRDLEETGVTALLVAQSPVTPEEGFANAFLRRSAYGSIRLFRPDHRRDARALQVEWLLGPGAGTEERLYRIERGVGLVAVAQSTDHRSATPRAIDGVRELLSSTGRASASALVSGHTGQLRLRDAWALAVRDCVNEALRNHEHCALLLAKLGAGGNGASTEQLAAASSSVSDQDRIACWVGDGELIAFGVEADRTMMEQLAMRLHDQLTSAAPHTAGAPVDIRYAVMSFPDEINRDAGIVDVLRDHLVLQPFTASR